MPIVVKHCESEKIISRHEHQRDSQDATNPVKPEMTRVQNPELLNWTAITCKLEHCN